MAKCLVNFVKNASKQGISSPEADALIVDLVQSEYLTETERKKILDNIGKNYPQLISSIFLNAKNANEGD